MTDRESSFYQCQRCGNCCRWPGGVALSEDEVESIAAFLKLAPDEFVNRYTDLLPDRRRLTLVSRPNDECVFLEHGACAIQPVKPRQCVGFPNTWNFPGWRDQCAAILTRQ